MRYKNVSTPNPVQITHNGDVRFQTGIETMAEPDGNNLCPRSQLNFCSRVKRPAVCFGKVYAYEQQQQQEEEL